MKKVHHKYKFMDRFTCIDSPLNYIVTFTITLNSKKYGYYIEYLDESTKCGQLRILVDIKHKILEELLCKGMR